MPINESEIKWDTPAINPDEVQWDDEQLSPEAATVGLTPMGAVPKPNPQLVKELKKVPGSIAKEFIGGIEATLGLASGALLWPFAKAYGLAALPWGKEAAQMAEESIGGLGYQPITEEGKKAIDPYGKAVETFLTPSRMAGDKLTEMGYPRVGYVTETAGELAQFSAIGGAKVGIKKGVARIKGPKPGEPGWTTPKGKAEALRKQQLKTKLDFTKSERPLEILEHKAKITGKMPKEGIPVEGKPISTTERLTIKPEQDFLEKAKVRVGGHQEIRETVSKMVEPDKQREYGLKIVDRSIPRTVAMQREAKAFVDARLKEGKTAEQSAQAFSKHFMEVQSWKGKEGLIKQLSDEVRLKGKEYDFGEKIKLTRSEIARESEIDLQVKKDFEKFGTVTLESGGLQTLFEEAAKLKIPKLEVSAYRSFKEFWKPFSSVPKGDKALFARYKGMGDVARAERFIDNIHGKLDKFPDDIKKDVFKYLDGQIPVDSLPIEARQIAKSLQERTKTIGRMLIKRGILKQEQFDKYKGKYIHYMYARHIVGEGKPTGLAPTGKLNLDYTRSRKDLTDMEKKSLGLVEDASIAVPVGMGKALTDIMKHDYLDVLSKESEWVWQPSIVEVPLRGKSVKMGIGKLVDEVNIYKKMVNEAPSKAVNERYKILQDSLDKAIKETGNIPKDYVQVPNVKTYGPLAGAYLRKPIADDLMPVVKSFANRGRLFEILAEVERQGMALFKIGKVATNLPTATRNVGSNILQNNMRGRSLHKIPNDIVNAVQSMKGKDKYHEEAFRHGLFKHSWAVTEINEILDVFSKYQKGTYADFLSGVRQVAKYYGKIDDVSKHAIYVQMRKSGNPIDVSILEATKWGMDYSLASRSVKHLRQHIMPFLSYQYKVTPLIAESIAKRPWVIGKYAAVPLLAIEATKRMNDMTDKDWDSLMKKVPLYIKKSGSMMIIPQKRSDGKWEWVNFEYFLPWGNQLNLFRDIKGGELAEIRQGLGITNPFLSIAEMTASASSDSPPKDPFTKKDIYNRLDKAPIKAGKMMKWLMFQWFPTMLDWDRGALGYSYSAAVGQKDKWGRKVTPAQAMGRWFGINVITTSPKQTAVIKNAKKSELKKDFRRITTDPRSSRKKKLEARDMLRKKLKELYR